MGFLDRLMGNIATGMNPDEPLFGGLIPRRVEEYQRPVAQRQSPQMVQNTPIRPSGIDRVQKNMLSSSNPNEGKNYVFDYTGNQIDLEKKKLDLAREKFGSEKSIAEAKLGLDTREQERKETEDKNKLGLDKEKLDIDHRKQALDEWKTRNPEGEVQTTKDGKIFVIDKRTGNTIDTGLMADHLSEEKKLELQAKNAKELETIRQNNRLALEKAKDKSVRISPTAQRAAEKDAASELLNDPNYSWLSQKGAVTFSDDGRVIIDRNKLGGKGKDAINAGKVLDKFQQDWKTKANERLNRRTESAVKTTVKMVTPKGETIDVPEDEVDEAKSLGADFEKPQSKTNENPPMDVSKALEIIRDSGGRVIYAGNVKGKR